MTLEMDSAASSNHDLLNQVLLSEESSQEESQKKRKLTNDSGYGDDIHERIESLHSNPTITDNQNFTRTSSLDSISENHTGTNNTEQAFHEMRTRFETSLNCDSNSTLSDNLDHNRASSDNFDHNDASFDCVDSNEEQIVETSKTKEKRRRMTPVPGGVSVFKPSKSSPSVSSLEKNNCSGRTILFVEEEDVDDIEGYNLEDDFICPDLNSCTSKLHIKRNSWHGITEGEKLAKFNRLISLTKSKSLDRGTDYPRSRRKRLANMSIPSISLEELTIDKRPGLTKQRSLNGDFTEPRCLFDGITFLNKSPSNEPNIHLPAWMQEAAEQNTDATTRQKEMHSCEEEFEKEEEKRSMEKLSTKLEIPEINWDKLNEEKNKTNKLLSEQRKALNKEKTKASSRRRRKLTPSESPSHASLEQLSSFKTKSEEWTLTEEDEEEEDNL